MRYKTPAAFRRALSDRLRTLADDNGEDLVHLQRRLAYERFLARLNHVHRDAYVLKGGYALELRLGGHARATKDLDFNAPPKPAEDILDDLADAAEADLGDFFLFTVAPPQAGRGALQGPPEGGQRFRVEAQLDGKPYAWFLVDVGQGDTLINAPERLPARIDLAFAELDSPAMYSYPLPEHFAEKLHAYTRPRPNDVRTRVKDLFDLSLIIGELRLAPGPDVQHVTQDVFTHYGTHPLPRPDELRPPPEEWRAPFAALARDADHAVTDMSVAYQHIVIFLGRCLSSTDAPPSST